MRNLFIIISMLLLSIIAFSPTESEAQVFPPPGGEIDFPGFAVCAERQGINPGEIDYWATFNHPGVAKEKLATYEYLIELPDDADQSITADTSITYYKAPIVLVDDGIVEVYCGENGEFPSTTAIEIKP